MTERYYRRLIVASIIPESESAKSFRLVPLDGGPLEPHRPGQHLPIRLSIPGHSRPVLRCYTISNFGESFYRLTIKKELPPENKPEIGPGLSSSFFHETVRTGTVIEAKLPAGDFWLDLQKDHPIAMLAGGIGVTPMMSMLEALARVRSRRDVYFFFGLRHAGDHVFKEKLNEIARQCSGLRMNIFYEQVRGGDIVRRDYDATGRISMNSLRAVLPKLDMEYYLCGPQGMMNMLSVHLTEAGVSPVKIRTESFGPSSAALRRLTSSDEGALNAVHKSAGITVTFARSQISVPWTGEVQSLLEFSEINGVDISSGCQYGDCGTCMTPLLEGCVKYLHATGVRPDPGCCLPCSCRPESSVVLDA